MKKACDWFKENGFTFDDKITIKDVIDLQNDARKDGLMTALSIASDVILDESPKYAKPGQHTPSEMTLSGLSYKVSSAILKEADTLEYLGEAMGYVCLICGDKIYDTQPTVHTDDGLIHESCSNPKLALEATK